MASFVSSIDTSGQTLLAGYGCGERGPYLVVDELEHEPWRRQVVFIREHTFTLTCCEERHCVGRHDLETGRGMPCPERATFGIVAREQCSECFLATGFNPAFYHAPRV